MEAASRKKQIGRFIDATVEDPQLARRLAESEPWLVNARWLHDETVVHFLAVEGFAPAVRLVLELGGDPNLKSELGHTPLIDMALLGNFEIAEALVAAGANVDETSHTHANVLHCAVGSGKAELVDLLLGAGAQSSYVTDLEETIFDAIPCDGTDDSQLRAVLEKYGIRRAAV